MAKSLIQQNIIDFVKTYGPGRIQDLLKLFSINNFCNEYEIRACCPIHHGTNPVGWSWSFEQRRWKCWTKECHQVYGSDIIGLVRGIKKTVFPVSVLFLQKFLNREPLRVVARQTNVKKIETINHNKQALNKIIPSIQLDDVFYCQRGISKEIISKYYIGICRDPNKKFYKRVYIPVLDEAGAYIVGYTARSLYEKCYKCEGFHDPNYFYCPKNSRMFSKWRHSKGFRKTYYLFNYWFAKDLIRSTETAIICEGPGDVLAFEQAGIHNSVGIFGKTLSEQQKSLLQRLKTKRLILCLDADEYGQQAQAKIKQDLSYFFDIHTVLPDNNDFGEMQSDKIRERFEQWIK